MKVGDVIEFDYEMFVEGHEGLYDTTIEDAAKAAGINHDGAYYTPMRYVVGEGRLVVGLEDALLGAVVGTEFEVEVPPEKGYGARDPANIDTVPIGEFRKHDVKPEPGLVINWKDRRGRIQTVGGGRVRVDFNPPLAGKKLTYKVTIRKVYADPAERIQGLFLMNYPAPGPPGVTIEAGETQVGVVTLPDVCRFDPSWLQAKVRLLDLVQRHTSIDVLRLVEDFDLAARRT